jgi:type II secretory pathway component PulK
MRNKALQPKSVRFRQNGSALLLVAWILLIMGSVSLFLLYRSSAEWASAMSMSRRIRLQEVAADRLRQCITELNVDESDSDDKTDGWFFGGRIDEEWGNQNEFKLTTIIEDEGSKPNINYVYAYQNLEVFLPKEISSAPLQDWIDRNEEPQNDGAENPYYQSLNPPYKSRDGFLSTLEEIKQIKDGDKLYPKLAPYFTVYGKANPNIINWNTFSNLLYSNGLKDYSWEKIMAEFGNLTRSASRTHFFLKADDFSRVGASDLDQDKMAPLFRFNGFCNLNLISLKGLKFLFAEAELNKDAAKRMIEIRENDPFKNWERARQVLMDQAAPKNQAILEDYFTVTTTVVRYKIWVRYQQSVYYLDTVWERYRVTNAKTKWQCHPLSWRILLNAEAPDIPDKDAKEEDEENQNQ